MLANAIYSVISPEGCASILWKDASKAPAAAEALRLRAVDLKELGVIDGIIAEPGEGAHEHPGEAMGHARKAIAMALKELLVLDEETLVQRRYDKFRRIGEFTLDDGFSELI
jgi:acetyl-CoA carboxylase carboxyl transferase subunit alpha